MSRLSVIQDECVLPIKKYSVLEKRLLRSERRVELLERLIEDKTREAYEANNQLQINSHSLENMYQALPSAMLVVSAEGEVVHSNKSAEDLLGYTSDELLRVRASEICSTIDKYVRLQLPVQCNYQEEQEWRMSNGSYFPVLVSAAILNDSDVFDCSYVFIASDLTERKQIELELRHSQKLESIGQLAAGVAHEINTPMQYIGDNAYFMQDSIVDILSLVDLLRVKVSELPGLTAQDLDDVRSLEEEIDLEYLKERLPKAAERTLVGVERVTKIVSAMKAFSHPSIEKVPTDLNEAIQTTLTIAKSEYKYVSEVTTKLGLIPKVNCNVGDINQVILNLVINASHAISDSKLDTLGLIEIESFAKDDEVVITIKDNGSGIPAHVQRRVFEPFFTTKEVGRGTGQGLALAYVVVVEKHKGRIYFETEEGKGTRFFIHLPVDCEV